MNFSAPGPTTVADLVIQTAVACKVDEDSVDVHAETGRVIYPRDPPHLTKR